MVLEASPHCLFDVTCMSDGRPRGSRSTRLEQQPSYDLAVALSTTGRTIILSNLNKRLDGRAGGSLNQEKPPPFGYQVERPVQPWRDDDDRH